MVSHNLQQRGAAEAVDVKFAVEQRMGSAVMLLQEVRNWLGRGGGQNVLSGYELYTDIDLDTAVAIPRDFACDVREKVYSKKYIFVVTFGTVWGSVHVPCHGDVSQDDLWSMHSFRLRALCTFDHCLTLPHVEWTMTPAGRTETPTRWPFSAGLYVCF